MSDSEELRLVYSLQKSREYKGKVYRKYQSSSLAFRKLLKMMKDKERLTGRYTLSINERGQIVIILRGS